MKPFSSQHSEVLHVTRLRLENEDSANVLGETRPRLSWVVEGVPDHSFEATCVQIEHRTTKLEECACLENADSVLVEWPFSDLKSRDVGSVRVRVGARDGRWTTWSDWCHYTAGLFNPSDWSASFISPKIIGAVQDRAPVLFRDFSLEGTPTRARIWISARGVYQAKINGVLISDEALAPGWTAYDQRLRYQSYDVTGLVRKGENGIDVILGNGWYRGQLTETKTRSSYGHRLALIAQLEIGFADGSTRTVDTDSSWRSSFTGILLNDLYDGEHSDLRVSSMGNRSQYAIVETVERGTAQLVARRGPAVKVTGSVPAVQIRRSPSGRMIVDFGQNLVGWVRLKVPRGRSGREVTIQHAEVLERGELALRPLRSAQATCRYVLSGRENEELSPIFTFSGFRYAEIEGIPDLSPKDVTALVVGTDLERTAWFRCSDPLLNRFHDNVIWSARGNFLDIPTDCPQRDERLGWTGDIQAFAPTANLLFDTSNFLAGWLEDLAAEQHRDGSVPFTIPDVLRDDRPIAAGWGDAATAVPIALYESFADKEVLRRQYESMRSWVDLVTSLSSPRGIWAAAGQFGDWLDPDAPPENAALAKADQSVVATAYYARSIGILARVANVIGKLSEARFYEELASKVATSFEEHFVSSEGIVRSDCQTVYALALRFELIANQHTRRLAGARLARLVELADYRIGTGFLGTPHLLDALSMAGYVDHAYRMLLQIKPPSWLYAVQMGATTVWERWDSMLPDGSINTGSMTSFNHYAYGAVADWIHRTIVGLEPLQAGYRQFSVCPRLGGGLYNASLRSRCPYGIIEVSWTTEADLVVLEVTVPFGATAQVWAPGDVKSTFAGWGKHRFERTLSKVTDKEAFDVAPRPRH